ncbi:MAG: NRAMP family divalent metal transporter [Candidatus Aminicenantia bacterium]
MGIGVNKWFRKILIFFSVMGPAFITSTADNDAGGIATYATAGAQEGYGLLWALFLITISLAVVQEMNSRMGIVTGQGLGGLIREKFGVKLTLLALSLLLIANIFVTVSNFSGVAAGFELLGIPRYISVPISAFLIFRIITIGHYKKIEKIFLLSTFFYFSYVISGFLAKPEWDDVWKGFIPSFKSSSEYLILLIAMIGTTITPWMQFYLQGSIADKRVKLSHIKYSATEVYIGSFFTDFIAFFIIVATAANLFKNGIKINSAGEAALALAPLAGKYCFFLFAIGLINASVLASAILPLSTSYAICEAFGWESGLDKKFKDAPVFFSILIAVIFLGSAVVLNPKLDLIKVMLISQTTNGILLPLILIFMIIIINDKKIMGNYRNNFVQNVISFLTAGSLIILTLVLIFEGVKELF